MARAPVFAERDPGVEHLQPSPQAADALQHVLDTGFKILLHLDQRSQRVYPARRRVSASDRERAGEKRATRLRGVEAFTSAAGKHE